MKGEVVRSGQALTRKEMTMGFRIMLERLSIAAAVSILFNIWPTASGRMQDKESEGTQYAQGNIMLNGDSLRIIDNLAVKLEQEIVSPSSNIRKVGSYLTGSQATVRKLIFDLAALAPRYADYIYDRCTADTTGASRAFIISLGLSKDQRVHENLRGIVSKETEPNLRAMAVVALSTYKDTLDVPIFVEALSDTNVLVMELDVATRDGKFQELVHPVGMEAVGVLHQLGYAVKFNSTDSTYTAVKIEE